MLVHERIRFFRQAKGWTQEEVADKLDLSPNGYGCIERGETDITLSRLEQLSQLFEIKLFQLLDADEKSVFNNLMGTNNTYTQNNQLYCQLGIYPSEFLQLKIEYEKQQVMLAYKDEKIVALQAEIEKQNQQFQQVTKTIEFLEKAVNKD
jgi:transcriptional regulator with XRE-family HTH domain